MKTIQQIKEDLKEIKTYYTYKNKITAGAQLVGDNAVVGLVEQYNVAVRSAKANLYAIYISVYVNGHSHEDAAYELSYSTQHIERLIKQLFIFFQKAFEGGARNAG